MCFLMYQGSYARNSCVLSCMWCLQLHVLMPTVVCWYGDDLSLLNLQELTHFQMFWNILDEIDKKVWVLSPKDPNRAVKRRLFALGVFLGSCSRVYSTKCYSVL